MQEEITKHVTIYCDNIGEINKLKHVVMHEKKNKISIKYHYLREKIQEKQVSLDYVKSKEKIVDIFTKTFPMDAFEYLIGNLGS